jgi:hypothetical protein
LRLRLEKIILALLVAVAVVAAGCATLDAPPERDSVLLPAPLRDCIGWFSGLDEQVARAGVRDAQAVPVAGFPYLRSDRLLAALRPLAETSPAALTALAARLRALDLEARRYEIMNLPALMARDGPATLERARQCGGLLLESDLAAPHLRDGLLRRTGVADDYRTADRFFGMYALTRFAFVGGIRRHEEETLAVFRREPSVPEGASVLRYAPPPDQALPRSWVAQVLERAARNALGIPEPAEAELQELLAAYAPSFEIAVKTDADRFGALRWRRDGTMPEVDGSQLAVYAHPAWTRYQGRVLLQLVYTIWFPERPPQSEGDILAGKLDGITWRVTLAPDGEPLVYDSIHPCGCYHMFFPTARAVALPPPVGFEEWMFAPQALPRVGAGERPVVRIASGTHYIERVSLARGSDSLVHYEIRPYGELRSLQRMGGGAARASAFGPDGLVAGSERAERFLFWPMGIASAGAMRQWGRHATAFVGRRHFDDADLFEKRFRFALD